MKVSWWIVSVGLSLLLCGRQAGAENTSGDWYHTLYLAEKVSRQSHAWFERAAEGRDSAITLGLRALHMAEEQSGYVDSSVGYILNRIGDYQFLAGRLAAAESLWTEALRINEIVRPEGHPERDGSLSRLWFCYRDQNRLDSDASLIRRAIALHDSLVSLDVPSLIPRVYQLAVLYAGYDDVGMFNKLMLRIVSLWERHRSGNPAYPARSLVFIAETTSKRVGSNVQENRQAQDSSIALGERALKIAVDGLAPDDTTIAWVMQRLGDYHIKAGNYIRGESLWVAAWNINREQLPEQHIEYQGSVYRLGSLHASFGRYALAEPLLKQALRLRIEVQGEGHPEVAHMHTSLALLYQRMGRFDLAEQHHREALRIRENAIERIATDIAASIRYLGQVHRDQGRYAEAESEFLRAYDIRKQALAPDHPLAVMCLEDLAELYVIWGRDQLAGPVFEQAVDLFEAYYGSDHVALAEPLVNLADWDRRRGDFAAAQELLERARDLVGKSFGVQHQQYARVLTSLGSVYTGTGRADLAVESYRQACQINSEFFGEFDHRLVAGLTDLASALLFEDRTDEARTIYERIEQIADQSPVKVHPDLARGLEACALFDWQQQDTTHALELAGRALNIRETMFADGVSVMSERDALRYARALHAARDLYLSLLLTGPIDSVELVAETMLASKGRVSDEIFRRFAQLKNHDDPVVRALIDSLAYVRSRLSTLYIEGVKKYGEDVYVRSLSEASADKNRYETELARLGRASGLVFTEIRPALTELVANIPEHSALIEYLRVEPPFDVESPYYVALVVNHDRPAMVTRLGSADTIEAAVQAYRTHMMSIAKRGIPPSNDDVTDYKHIATRLYEWVLDDVLNEIPAGETVLISPDGALNLVSFAGLTDAQGQYVIESRPVHYLACGRDLMRNDRDDSTGNGLFALGDPAFDASAEARAGRHAGFAALDSDSEAIPPVASWNLRSACIGLENNRVSRLPGTRSEIDRIVESWRRRSDEPAYRFTNLLASEENFKRYAPGKRIVHIATHGYFAGPDCAAPSSSSSSEQSAVAGENPLLRSGLLLAGANLYGRDAESFDVEDGITTAEEITSLDFTGTEIVFLSACESGLGEIKAWEGVYGLRRAFLLAGARSIVSSLWKVPDASAAFLMREIYRDTAMDIASRVHAASLAKLNDLRSRGQPDHPYYWAPFVSLGEITDISQIDQGPVTSSKE